MQKNIFYSAGEKALEQAAQRGCRVSSDLKTCLDADLCLCREPALAGG